MIPVDFMLVLVALLGFLLVLVLRVIVLPFALPLVASRDFLLVGFGEGLAVLLHLVLVRGV